MSDWDRIGFAPQGWQCPVCGAVYSPTTMQCFNCTGWKVTNVNTTESIDLYKEYMNHNKKDAQEER